MGIRLREGLWGVKGLCFFVVEFCLGVGSMAIWQPMVRSRRPTTAGSMANGEGVGDLGVWGFGFLQMDVYDGVDSHGKSVVRVEGGVGHSSSMVMVTISGAL